MTELFSAMSISAYGMRAQSERARVISENMANANTAAPTPGENPYTRQFITFKNEMNKQLGTKVVQVDKIDQDRTPEYKTKFMPDHPGADENGYVNCRTSIR